MSNKLRTEKDLLGDIAIDDSGLWGAHTQRAIENFPIDAHRFHKDFIRAYAMVKRAAAMANLENKAISEGIANAIIQSCEEIESGKYHDQIVVNPLSGGAGTSINMNFNEVIANLANMKLGKKVGDYDPVHPLNTVNLHQSTNDTFPTATRIAALWMLERLEGYLTTLQARLQDKEHEFADIVTVARTQLQDAVPVTMGQIFSTWGESTSRDRWRIFKCIERLKIVNIGGTAVGTGIGATRKYIFKVIEILRRFSGLPLTRADNPVEATSNQDAIVEVSGILSALATNLMKISSDLRYMSSPPVGELELPAMQAGSSIMPGKVNPVIPEYVSQMALKAISHNNTLSHAIGMGNLQLSQFFPLAGWCLLDQLDGLSGAVKMLYSKCIIDVDVNETRCQQNLENSIAFASAMVPVIGYENVEKAVKLSKTTGMPIREALLDFGATEDQIEKTLSPANLIKLGI
ncbi:MAG: aspartate ammonia-lyase [Candidatus Zixiibacteriota bacterium]